MPKIIQTEVFTYAELKELGSTKAIDKARQWLQDAITDGEWHEYILELWQSALSQIGFTDPRISYSGFWSQGDGASFTAKIDVAALAEFLANPPAASDCISGDPEDFRPYIVHKCGGVARNPKYAKLARITDWIDAEIHRTDSHYAHWNTCSTRIELTGHRVPKLIDKLVLEFRDDVETLRKDISKAIYKSLEQEYEDQRSEESITDFAEANEYTFTKDGKRFG
jgi:hypothetical protein